MREIQPDSPAARYLDARRRSHDNGSTQDERHRAYEEANRYALSFGYAKTMELDALDPS